MNKNNNQLELCSLAGAALLDSQKLEFLIHGIVSSLMHIKDISKDGRLKGLTATVFLSENPEGKKKRKQTLGVIIEAIKKTSLIIDEEGLEKYLISRNEFIHSLWRNYFKNGVRDNEGCLVFINNYIKETEHWMKVFKGLLSLLMQAAYEKEGRQAELLKKDMRDKEVDYYLSNNTL